MITFTEYAAPFAQLLWSGLLRKVMRENWRDGYQCAWRYYWLEDSEDEVE